MSIESDAQAALQTWGGRTVAGQDLPTIMLAMGGAESGWDDMAQGDRVGYGHVCDRYESEGWLQVNMNAHWDFLPGLAGSVDPCAVAQWLYDPVHCAAAADQVIGNPATDLPLSALRPWTTWWSTDSGKTDAGDGNGAYRYYLARARAAIAGAQGTTTAPGVPVALQAPPPAAVPPPTAGELEAIGLGILALYLLGEAAEVA